MLTKVLGLVCAGVFLGAAICEIKKRHGSKHSAAKKRTESSTAEPATSDAAPSRTTG